MAQCSDAKNPGAVVMRHGDRRATSYRWVRLTARWTVLTSTAIAAAVLSPRLRAAEPATKPAAIDGDRAAGGRAYAAGDYPTAVARFQQSAKHCRLSGNVAGRVDALVALAA